MYYRGDNIKVDGFKDYVIYNDKTMVAGKLYKIENLYFIKAKTKIYIPKKYDIVMGRIIYTLPDYYRVDSNGCIRIFPALRFLNTT